MTTPANPVKTSDLEGRFYRDLTEREVDIAQTWLDDAWDILLGRRPTLVADMGAGTVTEGAVIRVVVAMVSRVLSNPEGLLQEAIDDYSYRRDSAVSAGALYVSDAELADVTPGRRTRQSLRMVAYGEVT